MLETKKIQVGTDAEQYYNYGVEEDDKTKYGGDLLSTIPYHLLRYKCSLEFLKTLKMFSIGIRGNHLPGQYLRCKSRGCKMQRKHSMPQMSVCEK